jgi:ribonucleotide monophosphatase NagD (HAD superfamily)
MNSIKTELGYEGIESVGGEDDQGFSHEKYMSSTDFSNYKLDPNVTAVVVGMDTKFTYAKLAIATLYLKNGGTQFIACNDDAYDMIGDRRLPAAGAMLESIK